MKTGIEEIAAVKVNPRTEPLKGGAIMARILTASLISSLSKCNSDIDAAISDLARAGADIAAEIDRLNNLKKTVMREIKFRGKRLENGEWVYGSLVSIHDTPTCKESLPVDREYWRRVYAGEAMAARLALSGSWCMNETVKGAVEMADALLAELEK